MQKPILIATQNPGKIREISEILFSLNLQLLTPSDLSLSINPQETGSSYAENARIKALAYRDAANMAVLADDSGLEVDLLNGAPGVISARYAPGENATDADRRAYLIENLKGFPHPWKAHFHCTAIMAAPGGLFIETTGICHGMIIPEERGTGGFGYDQIFYLPEHQSTMAELPSTIKNKISHRARALMAMIPFLNVFQDSPSN
jgi:XTP/dITP diphosphohydrolase